MFTPATKEELEYWHFHLNMNFNEIAKKLNISISSVTNLMKFYNLKASKKKIKNPIGQIISGAKILKEVKIEHNNHFYECQCCNCENIFTMAIRKLARRKSDKCNLCRFPKIGLISISWWNRHVKDAANARNLIVDISIEEAYQIFLNQNGKCIYTGISLEFPKTPSKKDRNLGTASIDRIDNTKGYISGNIQWVHKKINYMKHIMSHEEFIQWCNLVTNNYKLGVNQ